MALEKPTLIRLLAGLLKATSGEIRVENCDPISDADTLRPQLGYMHKSLVCMKI